MKQAVLTTDNNHQGTMNPPINPSKRPQSGHQQSVMGHRSGGPVFVSPEGQFHVSLDSADQGIDAYIATGRLPHGKPPPPKRGPLPKDADEKTRMARKLRSKQGFAIYAQRKAIVEPVNGQSKEARGLRRFLLRGLEKVDAEWHLIAGTHNLPNLWRFRRSQQQGQGVATA